jgi:hypothetical protein
LFCVPDRGLTPSDALANLTNEDVDLVMLGGEINLLSDQLAGEVAVSLAKSLGRITMNSRPVWVAGFDASRLLGSARSALGEAGPIRLAGRMVEA